MTPRARSLGRPSRRSDSTCSRGDRDGGAAIAVYASIRATLRNPLMIALWGLIVAALLVIGSLPFLGGLAIVVPVLGHATWHLYRRVIEPLPHSTLTNR